MPTCDRISACPENSVEGGLCVEKDIIGGIARSWANGLNQYVNKEGKDLQKMILGIEVLLHNVPKMIIMVLVAYILGILTLTVLTWIPFAFIRRYAGGLHASNSISCTIVTMLMFVAVPYFLQGVGISAISMIVLFGIICLGLWKWSPADTKAKPIIGAKKRNRLKRQAVIACMAMPALALLIGNEAFYVFVLVGAVYALIVVLPITYKILRRSERNYEKYE